MDLVKYARPDRFFWGKYMKLWNSSETKTFTEKEGVATPEAHALKGAMKKVDPVWLLGCPRKLVNG